MSLIFSNDIIDIPSETRITLWRYNNGCNSPFNGNQNWFQPWDLSAKSVNEDSGAGIFGVWDEKLKLVGSLILFQAFELYEKQVFIELEADRRDIVIVSDREVSVSRCNIIRKMTAEEFSKEFPIYRDCYFWYKARANHPDYFGGGQSDSYSRFYQRCNQKQALSIFNYEAPLHGYSHSLRVLRNILLFEKHYKLQGLREFAYYHDIARLNDGEDPEHGKRAIKILERMRQFPHIGMQEDYFEKLCFACEHHTTMRKSGDPLIDICFDADRLDLMRVGIKPNPDMMATHIGAHYAENYDSYVADFQEIEYITG